MPWGWPSADECSLSASGGGEERLGRCAWTGVKPASEEGRVINGRKECSAQGSLGPGVAALRPLDRTPAGLGSYEKVEKARVPGVAASFG